MFIYSSIRLNTSCVSRVLLCTLQHTPTHCNTLQHTATHCNTLQHSTQHVLCQSSAALYTATHCNTLQHTATHCNTLQHTAAHCSTLQHTATHCNTLQHTATHCNTLQHTATHCNTLYECCSVSRVLSSFGVSLVTRMSRMYEYIPVLFCDFFEAACFLCCSVLQCIAV